MSIVGTSGNDHLTGTAGNNTFDLTLGGNDHADGLEGNDRYLMGSTLTADDRLDGGLGSDTVNLAGDYAHTKLSSATFTGIETLEFNSNHNYDIEIVEDNFTGAATINAGALRPGDLFTFDADRDNDTVFDIFGGAGNDVIYGGDGGNSFELYTGGSDTVTGGDAIDFFQMEGTFDATDVLKGGAGFDVLALKGDYSAGLFIANGMIEHIESINLSGDFDFVLSIDSHPVPFGDALVVFANNLHAPFHVELDASLMSNRSLNFEDGSGDDVVDGGSADDHLTFSKGGEDTANGNAGDDSFTFSHSTLDRDDLVDGGGGNDSLTLSASTTVVCRAGTIHSVETLTMLAGGDFDLTMNDGNVFAGATMTVSALFLSSGETLTFIGAAETDGSFFVTGSEENDIITGSQTADVLYGIDMDDRLNGLSGDDTIAGGAGSDRLNGGLGADTYLLYSASESTGLHCDITVSFNTHVDVFDLDVAVDDVDAKVTTGDLSADTFDLDLGSAIGAGELTAHHAVIFNPDGGDLEQNVYLVVDANGVDGYQINVDYVFKINAMNFKNDLSDDNFI